MTDFSCQIAAAGCQFNDVTVIKNGRAILKDITAEAPPGGATVVIGPNGAGKTTLLRCLLGETGYQGSISFFSKQGAQCDKPALGYVPQQLMADPQTPLRVYEFMALSHEKRPLWLGCSKRCRKIAAEYLTLVGAEKLENRRLGDLSGGELRRVLLANALSRRPALLVLDEAEAGVDYRGERLFWELLDRMRAEFGFTLIMVSHNLTLAAHYATHVICIRQHMLAQGSPRQTLTADLLYELFGVPIHIYPHVCENAGPSCPQCGAFDTVPHSGQASL